MNAASTTRTSLPTLGRAAFVRAFGVCAFAPAPSALGLASPATYWALENENDQVHPGEVGA